MPECENFSEWSYEELPPKAKEAARAMGYTEETWDEDEEIPYDHKGISECTIAEKTAANYLSMCVIEEKCDIWWAETDEETKKYAKLLGFDEEKWDDDWELSDLEPGEKYWKDLSSEQKEAATFFGFTKPTWDETYDIDGLPDWTKPMKNKPSGAASKKTKKDEEKKADSEVSSEDESQGSQSKDDKKNSNSNSNNKTSTEKKPEFKLSKSFGGDGGQPFNFGNNNRISKLVIHADRHCVHGLDITVDGGEVKKMGVVDGKTHEYTLNDDEFIVCATIRANKLVQCLTFKTNTGRELGPAGGKGWLIGHDKEGPEETIKAPFKLQLCGFSGKGGRNLDHLILHWGPVPARN